MKTLRTLALSVVATGLTAGAFVAVGPAPAAHAADSSWGCPGCAVAPKPGKS